MSDTDITALGLPKLSLEFEKNNSAAASQALGRPADSFVYIFVSVVNR